MDQYENVMNPGMTNPVEESPQDADKTCLPCLLPKVMAAWNSTRAACEFLPDPDSKSTCRAELDKIAADVKNIKEESEIILRAINSVPDPDAFIQAEIEYAIAHNKANSAALIKWAEGQEAAGKRLSDNTAKVIKILRLEQGI